MTLTIPTNEPTDLLTLGRSTARGMASGLAASWAMNRFQDHAQLLFAPGSGSSGDPATVKAADRLSLAVSGRHLKKRDKDVAGSAVHYVVGTLTGGLYGALTQVQPRASRWRGAAMGIATATLIDQLAVPVAGLARPPWKYSFGTHLYGYASHIVFGMATDAVRRILQDNRAPSQTETSLTIEDWALPLMLGLANGQRTMTPAAAVSITAASAGLDLARSRLAFLSSPWTAAAFGTAALGEYYVDIQPGVPARIAPMGIGARMAGGALAGAATARKDKHVLAAVVGAGGALAGAYISYRVRMRIARAFGFDRSVGLAEDLLSLGGSLALAGFAALRARRPATT
jgi:uncharacterized membrane protein